ncbi:hypothetical protein [Streptomyces sp. SAJ15]|uniref:hypothetical protein n=1 Tax=Streptomyces sp. SAJ15 TaxID=2011095 RepID=UPI001186D4E3|nr:hypothetical protein [Streptomyces sp. SAJ15]
MTAQHGWASCAKCQGLHFAGFHNGKGVCPAGGQHEQTGSFAYEMDFDVPEQANVQTGWASCPRCQGLHFAGFPDFKGVCPAGGQHEQTGSFAYALRFNVPPPPGSQAEWRSCPKCQGLFFGPFQGRCPADGGVHIAGDSFNYVVTGSPRPFVTLGKIAPPGQGVSIEVAGRGYTPTKAVKLIWHIKRGNTLTERQEAGTVEGSGMFRALIELNPPNFTSVGVKAVDIATNADASASIFS